MYVSDTQRDTKCGLVWYCYLKLNFALKVWTVVVMPRYIYLLMFGIMFNKGWNKGKSGRG